MNWLDKLIPNVMRKESPEEHQANVPEGLWQRCSSCASPLYRPELERNLYVCPKCGWHMRLSARQRLDMFLDPGSQLELADEIEPHDLLKFKDTKRYRDRLNAAQKLTMEKDALIAVSGMLKGIPVVVSAFNFDFLGGSMGYAVGQKFANASLMALEQRQTLVCFAASGGARMQEALISLMQMPKTSVVLQRLKEEGVPYFSVLTDPVYGGVSASLASLGDINIAEPGVRAGFSGPEIIRDTIRQQLPEGFQRGEFLLDHGAIDMIVPRAELRDVIASLASQLLRLPEPPAEYSPDPDQAQQAASPDT